MSKPAKKKPSKPTRKLSANGNHQNGGKDSAGGGRQAANIGGRNHKMEMSMAKDGLKQLQDQYREKQKAKVEIEKPRHVENYDAKLKKHKTPPSAGKKY
jgi:hypothetical protein